MKNSILVNTFNLKIKGGAQCDVVPFNEAFPHITNPIKEKNPVIQAFNSGYRVDTTNTDWNTWNGLVFVDIDGKKYFEHSDNDYKELNNALLLTDLFYDKNFFAMQESFSHNGCMHFFFYFDVKEKSEHIFNCCAKYAYQKVVDAYLETKLLNANVASYVDDFITYPDVVDTHNINPRQVFLIIGDEIQYGFECNGDISNIDFSKDATSIERKIEENIEITSNDYADGAYEGSKIIIDRHFKIGTYSGNDVRWRISRIADVIFGQQGKSWCDKYFCKRGGASIYSNTGSFGINNIILNWLINNDFINKVSNNEEFVIDLDENEFLSDKYYELIDNIDKYDRVEIVAGTGTGKTSVINGTGADLFGYTTGTDKSIAYKYNAVVIVPYNTTNKLYNNCVEIGTQSNNEYTDDKPVVMVFDQAVKHWSLIQHRNIIIDEVHTLFTDRTYRHKVIELLNLIKTYHTGKLICFTATPTGEVDALNLKCINIQKPKNKVYVAFEYNKNICGSIIELCDYFLNTYGYDRVVVMDDNNAERVYQNLLFSNKYTENEIAYIRSRTKGTDDFNNLLQTEMLNKPITICTRVAYNGLNFKNEDEKIAVICSYRPMTHVAADYVQILGRFRNCKNVLGIIVYNTTTNEDYVTFNERNEEQKIIKSVFGGNQYNDIASYDNQCDNEDVVEAKNDVEQYYLKHSMNLTEVMNDLHNYKYLVISQFKLKLTPSKYDYPFATEENNMFKQWVNTTENWLNELTPNKFEECQYLAKPVNKLIFARNTYNCNKIEEYVMKNLQTRHLEGVVDELMLIFEIATMSDEEFNNRTQLLNELRCKFASMNNEKWVAILNQNENKRNKYRKQWKGVSTKTLNVLFENIITEYDLFFEGVVENRSKAGKMGKAVVVTSSMKAKNLSKYNLEIGQSFDSCGVLAEYCNVSNQCVSAWMKKGWIK